MPLSSIFTGDMQRLKFELSLPTMDPKLAKAIEDERDRCAAEFANRQLSQSAANRVNGSKPKKKPEITGEVLEAFRKEYVIRNEHERGWKKAARLQFAITENTIRTRMEENE